MRRSRFFWQLFPTYLLVILVTLLTFSWYALRKMEELQTARIATDLETTARLLAQTFVDPVRRGSGAEVDRLVKRFGGDVALRLTILSATGAVLGDSDGPAALQASESGRSEVRRALQGETGTAVRANEARQEPTVFVAVPLRDGPKVVGALRAAMSMGPLRERLLELRVQALGGAALAAALAALVGFHAARRIAGPIEQIERSAERLARGELTARVPVPANDELRRLAETLNAMAALLADRVSLLTRQRNEIEAVLASMEEGVLAVDRAERLLNINRAALRQFGVQATDPRGRNLYEVIRNTDLQQFVAGILAGGLPASRELRLYDEAERLLEVHGLVLRDALGAAIGALVVASDVTQLRRLEQLRREFVANVSHELKTPITAIQGFVETLLEGDLRDAETTRRFLGIVGRQAERLNQIIEDLLTLSRIEQGPESGQLAKERAVLAEILQSSKANCLVQANEQNVAIEVSCPAGLAASVNAALIEQAVTNLIDNAVKYGGPGKVVRVEAEATPLDLRVRVIDQGRGIEERHLPRLFERFYRVDRARSRKLGGSGLGLAIVKHIAQAHGGSVEVQSTPGAGSTFSIVMPRSVIS
ncbi:MAG: HAMP domain-containing protein [Candidatus Lambdaproteobacteria bacterium]|nr:HAMP domain-containing protein [Candidatus Lambdaproteobacteria bacterium]